MEASRVQIEHERPLGLTLSEIESAFPSEGSATKERVRRTLNVAGAAVLLVLCTPAMLIIAALIKLTSRGPVLFIQPRIGLDRRNGGRPVGHCRRSEDRGGAPFMIYKFRTMYSNASADTREVWARPNDPRVTPLGRLLRRTRLDELPQLINVIKGEMNLVGPRPEQPQIFARLREALPGYEARQCVRPGITGWAQVNQSYDRTVEDVRKKVRFDLEYIRRRSPVEDLRIMARTVPVVLLRRGGW